MEQVLAGRYRVLRKLAAGGMAEVFLARQSGLQGFEKLVVVKRVLPSRARLAEYVQRFLDEARATAELHHPNVVDVFDVGEEDDGPFMVMEYLQGEDLRRLMAAADRAGAPLSLGVSLQVVIDAARGLHHAHAKKDSRGNPLNLVHRDVSPSNLVVTFDGITKVVDFGIARYRQRLSEETEEGLVRGKPFYMSPEQARGEAVDARSDQFSLGIVLFELTTGRRLHTGAPLTALERVSAGDLPSPTDMIADYPIELSAIVRRAMARFPEERFPSCAVLADTLETWLDDQRIPHGASRVAATMRELFGAPPEATTEEAPETRRPAEPDPPTVESRTSRQADPAPSGGGTVERRLAERMRERVLTTDSNLPDDADVLLGRDEDLAAVGTLLDAGNRLVTLVGPGGAGKTRLAVRVAGARRPTFRDGGGVWFFDLTEARTADALCRAVSRTLSAAPPAAGEDAADALGRALAGRGPTLVVLDNLEQVVEDAAGVIRRWLETAPQAVFLATSRERLRLRGEAVHEVPPLSVPAPGSPPEQSAAVRLFLHRAKSLKASWVPGPSELEAIAELVRLLEGHPLAIELAAARIGVLPPAKLLERLRSGLDLLGSAFRATHARQATLRGAVEWSWQLLSPHEQGALAQLSVFRGGFELEAAEAVLSLGEGAPWAIDVLESLKDKSLLRVRDTDDGPRWDTYLPVRECAAAKLKESGAGTDARRRHADHFARLAAELAGKVDERGGLEHIRRLALETENLAAVVDRAVGGAGAATEPGTTTVPVEAAVAAVLAMESTVGTRDPRGYLGMIERVLVRAPAAAIAPRDRAALLVRRGRTRRVCGSPREAVPDLTEGLRLAREAGDRGLEVDALVELGRAAGWSGHRDAARAHLGEALSIARAAGDAVREGAAATYLGGTVLEVDPALARELLERALALHRHSGNKRLEAVALQYRSYLLRREGEVEPALKGYAEAAALFRQVGDRVSEADAVFVPALLAMDDGRLEDAAHRLETAGALAREVGNARTEAYVLANQAILLQLQGRHADALAAHARALGAFERLGNRAMAGFYACFHAIACADAGDDAGADAALARARAARDAGGAGDLPRLVELAERRRALDEDPDAARLALAALSQPPPGGGRSERERSEDLRFAARLLEGALSRA